MEVRRHHRRYACTDTGENSGRIATIRTYTHERRQQSKQRTPLGNRTKKLRSVQTRIETHCAQRPHCRTGGQRTREREQAAGKERTETEGERSEGGPSERGERQRREEQTAQGGKTEGQAEQARNPAKFRNANNNNGDDERQPQRTGQSIGSSRRQQTSGPTTSNHQPIPSADATTANIG